MVDDNFYRWNSLNDGFRYEGHILAERDPIDWNLMNVMMRAVLVAMETWTPPMAWKKKPKNETESRPEKIYCE